MSAFDTYVERKRVEFERKAIQLKEFLKSNKKSQNKYGYKSIIDQPWNTPVEFQNLIFDKETKRNRCDRIMFVLGFKQDFKRAFVVPQTERTICNRFGLELRITDSKDEMSLESSYLNHAVQCTTCYIFILPFASWSPHSFLLEILEILPSAYPPETTKKSTPILVFEDVETHQGFLVVDAFYLWEAESES